MNEERKIEVEEVEEATPPPRRGVGRLRTTSSGLAENLTWRF